MPRLSLLHTNFTAGELTPKTRGRVDLARYANGAEKMRDLIPQVHGGAKRRPATLYVEEVKDSSKATRLIPFTRNGSNVYVLEFGHLYMRVYKDGAILGAPYELPTVFTEAQLFEMDYTQGGDTMFLFHEDVFPQKLVCAGDTSWTIANADFISMPYNDTGTFPAATLTPSALGPIGETIYLCAGEATGTTSNITTLSWASGLATVNLIGHGRNTGDVVSVTGTVPLGYSRTTMVTRVDANDFTYPLRNDPGEATTNGRYTVLSPTPIFAAGDVGKTVKINGGVVEITAFLNTGLVQGIVKKEMSSIFPAPKDAWSLHTSAWTVANGYPRTGTFYEQRLVCGGSPTFPQTIWNSGIGAYLDFLQGVEDDDAFAYKIGGDVTTDIRYLSGARSLVVLTSTGEFTVDGGLEKPYTPTTAKIKPRTNHGCASVRPVRYNESELYVQRSRRKVRSFGYNLSNDDWTGPDLSVLAEHLTEGNMVDMCWQQEPDSIVWMARGDGALLSITLDREQEVTGWAWHEEFYGAVESLASISLADGDQVWMVVRRTINGATKRYVERLSPTVKMDSALITASVGTTVTVAHLVGQEVHAVDMSSTNPIYLGAFTVSGAGTITLNEACSAVHVGKRFRPRLKMLPPEVQTGMGSASGNAQRTSEVTVRFHQTASCKVNDKPMEFRVSGAGALDTGLAPFTGVKRLEVLGWERGESPIEFTQDEPLDFHILSVTRKFTVND